MAPGKRNHRNVLCVSSFQQYLLELSYTYCCCRGLCQYYGLFKITSTICWTSVRIYRPYSSNLCKCWSIPTWTSVVLWSFRFALFGDQTWMLLCYIIRRWIYSNLCTVSENIVKIITQATLPTFWDQPVFQQQKTRNVWSIKETIHG